jgi:tetratricopeptide (TPR) repeat protein
LEARLKALSLQAREAQNHGDYRAAAASYEEILKLRPELAEVRANLGLMHHMLGEYSAAVQAFELTLREKPNLFVPNLFLGLDLLRLQQFQRALPYLQRAQHLNPLDEQANLGLAQCYAALLEFETANGWYARAAGINPKNFSAWFGLGITYLNLNRLAIERLRKIGLDSAYARALLAESLEEQGQVGDAIEVYRKLLDSQPTLPGLHAALGFAYVEGGDVLAAEREFRTELSGGPGCLMARLGLARVCIERWDIAAALKELAEAWKADRNFVEGNASHLWLGLNLEKIDELEKRLRQLRPGQTEAALVNLLVASLERWRQIPLETFTRSKEGSSRGTDSSDFSDKGLAQVETSPQQLYSQGRYTHCAEMLGAKLSQLPSNDLLLLAECAYYSADDRTSLLASGEVLKASPEDLAALYWRAKGAQKLAVSALMRAGLAEPDSPTVHLLLGEAFLEKQNLKEAEVEYRKVLQLQPQNRAARFGLATMSFRVFEYDKAFPELQKVLELNPADPEANFMMGYILVYRHQYSEAVPYLKAALKGVPSTVVRAHASLGKVYASQGRLAEAEAELKQALAGDSDGTFHFQLYQVYKELGDEKAALDALNKSQAIRRNYLAQRQQVVDLPP